MKESLIYNLGIRYTKLQTLEKIIVFFNQTIHI